MISILLPLGKGLRESIASVSAQTDPRWELLVIDKRDPDVRLDVPDGRVRGVALANDKRNSAGRVARGDALVWLTCGDTLAPNAVELFDEVLRSGADIAYSDFMLMGDLDVSITLPDWSLDAFMAARIPPIGYAVRKSFWSKLDGWRVTNERCADIDLFYRAAQQKARMGHIREALYQQRLCASEWARGGYATKLRRFLALQECVA